MKNTQVVFVLDESGSMAGKESFIQSAFKEQATVLQEAKKAGKIQATLVRFGARKEESKPFVEFHNRTPSAFSLPAYAPHGNTPLCDAVALGVKEAERGAKSNTAFLVTVFTDGEENASTNWTGRKLADLIEEKQASGNWTFNFIGPSTKDVSAWGVPAGNIYTYKTIADGMFVAASGTSVYLNTVRPMSASTTCLVNTVLAVST